MKVWIIIVIVIISILIIGFGLGLLYLNFNPEITCGFSKDLDKKNGCYYNAAQKSQDFNFCDNIIDSKSLKDECYKTLGINYYDEYLVIEYSNRDFFVWKDLEPPVTPNRKVLKVKRAEYYTPIQLFGTILIRANIGRKNVEDIYKEFTGYGEGAGVFEIVEIEDRSYFKRFYGFDNNSVQNITYLEYRTTTEDLGFFMVLEYNTGDYQDYSGETPFIDEEDIKEFEEFLPKIIFRDNPIEGF